MKKLSQNNRESTVVITDIRNFTGVFEHFQDNDNPLFLDFIIKYYDVQMYLAEKLSRGDLNVSTTGDGILSIFMGKNHQMDGYAYSIMMYRVLTKMCKEFTEKNNIKVSFGIGADSGKVWNIKRKSSRSNISTYVGSVINRTSRIESSTKTYYHTNMAVGGHLHLDLIKILYPEHYDDLKRLMTNYDQLLEENPDTIMISKELLLYYIFEKELKGVKDPIPIFRLSPTLAINDLRFKNVLKQLIGESKSYELCKELL